MKKPSKITYKKKLCTIALTLFYLISFSCSQNLSRTEAADIIIKQLKYPQDVLMDFEFGEQIGFSNIEEMKAFEKDDLITLKTRHDIGYKVYFTEKGKQYFASKITQHGGVNKVKVKIAEILFVDITGITATPSYPPNKTFTVQYTWKYGNFTPFGKNVSYYKIVKDKNSPATVNIFLFDDGWRIAK